MYQKGAEQAARELASFDGINDKQGHYNDVGVFDKGYTSKDQNDMYRLGRRQELMRNFRPLSALAFTVLLQATWECVLMYGVSRPAYSGADVL